MAAQRRVTLRTAWVQDEEKVPGSKPNPGIQGGPNCPSCGVPLKRTSSGTMYCWFCEKEFDIDPTQFKQSAASVKSEPEFGRPASDFIGDEDIESPDGKKEALEEEEDFEMDLGEEEGDEEEEEEELDFEEEEDEEEEGDEEEEEVLDFEEEDEEEEEGDEEEEEELDFEEEDEEEGGDEEEEEELDFEEEDEEEGGDEEEEEVLDFEEEDEEEEYDLDMEEDDEVEEIEEDEDVFDPSKWKKKKPSDLEELDDEDFEVELDE